MLRKTRPRIVIVIMTAHHSGGICQILKARGERSLSHCCCILPVAYAKIKDTASLAGLSSFKHDRASTAGEAVTGPQSGSSYRHGAVLCQPGNVVGMRRRGRDGVII